MNERSAYEVSFHLLDLDFDGVEGVDEELALFHDSDGERHGGGSKNERFRLAVYAVTNC